MLFSIIIPSRNRPALLRRAIDSVLAQTHPDVEVIVVNDGTTGDDEAKYKALEAELSDRVRFAHLVKTSGHGQSYANDFGVRMSKGDVVGFLDDDDEWIDTGHLARAARAFEKFPNTDVYYTDQQPLLYDKPLEQKLWLSGLEKRLSDRDPETGSYPASVSVMMEHPGFAHVNCTLITRRLFEEIDGFDHDIRYECDRDFFLRSIDHAREVRYDPTVMSKHYVPDPKKTVNMSTAVSLYQKMLYRSYVLDKAVLLGKHAEIRKHGRQYQAYTKKRFAEELDKEGRTRDAFFYASQALVNGFTVKWLGYWGWLGARSMIGR